MATTQTTPAPAAAYGTLGTGPAGVGLAYVPVCSQSYGLYGSKPPTAAPTSLRTTATTSSTISLAWNSAAPAGSPYTLERAPVDSQGTVGAFAALSPGPGTAKAYQDMALAFITTYAYRVKATVNGVDSAYSQVLQATTAGGTSTADIFTDLFRENF